MSETTDWVIKREQRDPLANRISIGSPHMANPEKAGYVVYRGDPGECIQLLEIALAKFKESYYGNSEAHEVAST